MFKKGLITLLLLIFPLVTFWEVNPAEKCNTANSYVSRFTESLRWDVKWSSMYKLHESNIAHHQRIADFYCPKVSAYLEEINKDEEKLQEAADLCSGDKECWEEEKKIADEAYEILKSKNIYESKEREKIKEEEKIKEVEKAAVKKFKDAEKAADEVVNDVPEVKKLDAQLDIIENPDSTEEEKEAAYKKLKKAGIDTWDWWFSSSNAEDARKSIDAKKEEVKKTLTKPELTNDQIIAKARNDIWDTDGLSDKQIAAKVDAKISEIKNEQNSVKAYKEKAEESASLNKDAVSEAESEVEIARTDDAINAEIKRRKNESIEDANKAIVDAAWWKEFLTEKEQKEIESNNKKKQKPTLEEENALEKYNKALEKKEEVATAVNNGWVVKSDYQKTKESYESCKPATSNACEAKKDLYEAQKTVKDLDRLKKYKEWTNCEFNAWSKTCRDLDQEIKNAEKKAKEWLDSIDNKKKAVDIEEWIEKAKNTQTKACKNKESTACKDATAKLKDKEHDKKNLETKEAEAAKASACKKPTSQACTDAKVNLEKAEEAETTALDESVKANDTAKEYTAKEKKDKEDKADKGIADAKKAKEEACKKPESVECSKAKEELKKSEEAKACLEPDSEACNKSKDETAQAQAETEATEEAAALQAVADEAQAKKDAKEQALSKLPKVNCIWLPGCVDKDISKPTPASTKKDLWKVVITSLIWNLIQYVAVFAVIALMLSGIMYLVSWGEEEKVKKAKSWITWSLIWVLLSTTAWWIINIVNNLIIK